MSASDPSPITFSLVEPSEPSISSTIGDVFCKPSLKSSIARSFLEPPPNASSAMPTPAPMLVPAAGRDGPNLSGGEGWRSVQIGLLRCGRLRKGWNRRRRAEGHHSEPIARTLSNQLDEERGRILRLVELRASNRRCRRRHASRAVEHDHHVERTRRRRGTCERGFDGGDGRVGHAAPKARARARPRGRR